MFKKGKSRKLNHYEYFDDLNGKRELQVNTRGMKSDSKTVEKQVQKVKKKNDLN